MDAIKTFEDVLSKVENSRLNFALTRTPFSAIISLKSSFVKSKANLGNELSRNELEDKKVELNDETCELKSKVKMLEKACRSLETERNKFEELYQQEKDKNKASI